MAAHVCNFILKLWVIVFSTPSLVSVASSKLESALKGSALLISLPKYLALYSSKVLNAEIPTSAKDLANLWFLSILFTLKLSRQKGSK
ncbi:hypothetical protein NHP194003_06020 [Helicobacter suis]|nr:hypothetical protein NHP194003_06020 [Helicobacter suis]BCD49152.1 hypothetical protein NHP194004_05990 [Helicobacter suis]BCD51183.1 hypothetical protein NHP194022_08540 [Helicobacter suis]